MIMGKQKNIPALRFPEFTQKWTVKKLKDVTLSIDSGWSPQCEEMPAQKGEWGVLKTTAVVWEGFNENENKKLPIKLIPKPDFEVKINDILITRAGPTNRVGVAVHVNKVRERLMLSDKIIRIRTTKDVSSPFIVISLSNKFAQSQILSKSSGLATSQTNISQNILLNVLLPITDHKEQTKIASFLTAIDDRLQALKKKKALLEQYKKGIMQKIFSQELRFKDNNGEEFPDWEEPNGGFLFDSISNKNHNSDLPILAITQEHGAIPRDLIDYKVSVTDKSVDSYKVVEMGDYIISLRSFQGGIEYSEYKGICSPAYIILRPKKEISRAFYKYYFKTDNYIQLLNKTLEGIRDGKMISYKHFSEISLPFPCLTEQTKIANFFSAIDDKLTLCQTQIEKTEKYKKGLLQKMFC